MKQESLIIIGAGLAGLAAGIYAQKAGFATRILEHQSQPGGVAATWQRGDYTIDGGVHFYMGYQPGRLSHRVYEELGVAQDDMFQTLDTYARFWDPAREMVLDLTQDLNRFAAQAKAMSPEDSLKVDEFIRGCRAFAGKDLFRSLAKPPEMIRPWDYLSMALSLGRSGRYFSGKYLEPMSRWSGDLKDPWLAQVMNHIFMPSAPVGFVMMIIGALAGGELAARRDGSAGFARNLEKTFTGLGGEITYSATVEEILVEKGRAQGVRLASGQELRASCVISTGDGYSTIFKLLGGRFVGKQFHNIYQNWKLFDPIVLIHLGVDRVFDSEPWLLIYKSPKPVESGFLKAGWWSIRLFNLGPGFAPPGKTLVQVMVDTTWHPWRELKESKRAYQKEKERLAQEVIGSLNMAWPGLARLVEMHDVATPYTMHRYTLNRQGAFEGFSPTAAALRTPVPRTLPGLKDFFMAGQWTTPGGGVMPSLLSGRHAVMLLCRDRGQPLP